MGALEGGDGKWKGLVLVVVFLNTKVLNELRYGEDCCAQTRCINAF